MPVVLDEFSPFARAVLNVCRDVTFGRTIAYGQLAQKAGSPFAARAVGVVMAHNPLPLIIPCHRVVRSDGKIGGFSAQGGPALKKRMLELERQALRVASRSSCHLPVQGFWLKRVVLASTRCTTENGRILAALASSGICLVLVHKKRNRAGMRRERKKRKFPALSNAL